MSLSSMILAAAETHSESGVSPYLVGGITLGILLAMLVGLLMFGRGREHS